MTPLIFVNLHWLGIRVAACFARLVSHHLDIAGNGQGYNHIASNVLAGHSWNYSLPWQLGTTIVMSRLPGGAPTHMCGHANSIGVSKCLQVVVGFVAVVHVVFLCPWSLLVLVWKTLKFDMLQCPKSITGTIRGPWFWWKTSPSFIFKTNPETIDTKLALWKEAAIRKIRIVLICKSLIMGH